MSSEEEKAKLRLKKAHKLAALQEQVLSMHQTKTHSPEALALTATLLNLNCDYYTAWNYRRAILTNLLEASSGCEARTKLVEGELRLTQELIAGNPKSYWAWHHRRWVLSPATGTAPQPLELELCANLLDADPRNFHCWRHRLWASGHLEESFTDRLAFVTAKINQNFSNYSAWHYRSKLLAPLEDAAATEQPIFPQLAASTAMALLTSEMELTKQAFYTEPEDQSAWLYHRWLVTCAENLAARDVGGRPKVVALLAGEIESCDELLDLEPESKWPTLTKALLQQSLDRISGSRDHHTEIESASAQLSVIDPLRQRFYASLAA